MRAVEGLTQPPRYKMTASFVSRSQLFIGDSKRNEALLRQLYTLRSCMEHVQLWRHELKKVRGLNAEQSLLFRALQAELLASAVLMGILRSPPLLRHFRTEKTIAPFWALPDADRRKLWGKPFALDREAKLLYQAF